MEITTTTLLTISALIIGYLAITDELNAAQSRKMRKIRDLRHEKEDAEWLRERDKVDK